MRLCAIGLRHAATEEFLRGIDQIADIAKFGDNAQRQHRRTKSRWPMDRLMQFIAKASGSQASET